MSVRPGEENYFARYAKYARGHERAAVANGAAFDTPTSSSQPSPVKNTTLSSEDQRERAEFLAGFENDLSCNIDDLPIGKSFVPVDEWDDLVRQEQECIDAGIALEQPCLVLRSAEKEYTPYATGAKASGLGNSKTPPRKLPRVDSDQAWLFE